MSTMDQQSQPSPFLLENEAVYQAWREQKLAAYPQDASELIVEVADPRALSDAEKSLMSVLFNCSNMLIYNSNLSSLEDKDIPRKIGEQLGLHHLDPNMLADDDGITSLTVVPGKLKRGYIPYSDKRLLWHTDGYYNKPEQQIRAVILHCVRPAVEGGENGLVDPEMIYIQLRDMNPDYIRALMHPQAMTIPANVESGEVTRAAQSGPVFSLDFATNCLHMRYTARTRSIEWRDDLLTKQAVDCLTDLLNDENPYVFNHILSSGQGLVCNNVLHSRTAFSDTNAQDGGRLLYRARYYERVSDDLTE
ncbi:MAG: TauD/TfdA family dioxygenase [Sulfuriflexus sp.]|nr:TauD/TfdA family dioxygenase [Sulfuriflexus sp.]